MTHWIKLDENKKFITYECNTVHEDSEGKVEPGWYKVSDEIAIKVLKFMYNSEFIFGDDGNIVDVQGEEWIPPEEPQPQPPSIEERLSALEMALLELAGI